VVFIIFCLCGGVFLKQKEIEAAASMMRIFLLGVSLNFNADYNELEEIAKKALLQIESETT
jgi:hypothetical protein